MIAIFALLVNMSMKTNETFSRDVSVGKVITSCPCTKSAERLAELQRKRDAIARASDGIAVGTKSENVKRLQKLLGHRERGKYSTENRKRLENVLKTLDKQIKVEKNWQDAKPRLVGAARKAKVDPAV